MFYLKQEKSVLCVNEKQKTKRRKDCYLRLRDGMKTHIANIV